MIKFILKRTFYGFIVLVGVAHVVFFIFHAMPGDPVDMMTGPRTDKSTREAIRKEHGLDRPLLVQLRFYLSDLSPIAIHENSPEAKRKYNYKVLIDFGDVALVAKAPYFRRSFQSQKRVDEIIWDSLPGTLWLSLAAITFATIFGVIFGMIAALKQNTFWDHFLVTVSVMGISVPSFVSAILVSMLFGYYLAEYTNLGITGSLWEIDPIRGRQLRLENLILPAFTLGIRPLAIITQLTRSSMLDVLNQDYMRTALAKGVSKYVLIVKHALKNALNPVITAVSGWMASLMAGAFFVEYIFSWKGLGLKTIQAVGDKDFPVVMGAVLFIASIFVVVNIVVDILYAAVDPRVRLGD